jgi:hypothetical protein
MQAGDETTGSFDLQPGRLLLEAEDDEVAHVISTRNAPAIT